MKHFEKIKPAPVIYHENDLNRARFPDGVKIDFVIGMNVGSETMFANPSVYEQIRDTMLKKHMIFVRPHFRFKGEYYKPVEGGASGSDELLADFGGAGDIDLMFPVSKKVYASLKKTIKKHSLIVVTINEANKPDQSKPAEVFFRIDGGGGAIHFCNDLSVMPICGTRLRFCDRGIEVRIIEQEVKEKWGDGIVQGFKWVRNPQYEYCKKCSVILKTHFKSKGQNES